MKVLILGASGFLGMPLAHRWLSQTNARLTLVDRALPNAKASDYYLQAFSSRFDWIKGSILDNHFLSDAVQNQDIIYNCAAQTSHTLSLENPLLDTETNVVGNLKLLEVVSRRHDRIFVRHFERDRP